MTNREAWVLTGLTNLLRTRDGGHSWQRLVASDTDSAPLGAMIELRGVTFVTVDVGWLRTASGIWRTTDSGLNWEKVFQSGSGLPVFRDGKKGWMSVNETDSLIRSYVSTDGGLTWAPCGEPLSNEQPTPTENTVFLNDELGWATTRQTLDSNRSIYSVARTDDGGCTWKDYTQKGFENRDERLGEVVFINSTEGFVGGQFYIYYTHDGGLTWSHLPLPEPDVKPVGVHFTDNMTGWVSMTPKTSTDTGVFKTTDRGETWSKLESNDVVTIPSTWGKGRLIKILWEAKGSE